MSLLRDSPDVLTAVFKNLDKTSLTHCAKVSRSFVWLVTPILYQNLSLSPTTLTTPAFRNISHHNTGKTRSLHVTHHDHSLCATLPPFHLPNLSDLSMDLVKVITGPAHLCIGAPDNYVCPLIRHSAPKRLAIAIHVSSNCKVPVGGKGLELDFDRGGLGERVEGIEVNVKGEMMMGRGSEWVRDESWTWVLKRLGISTGDEMALSM